MKNSKKYFLGVLLVACIIITIWISSHSQRKEGYKRENIESSSPTPEHESRQAAFREKIRDFYRGADADISFYGRVIDEKGKGVDDAMVSYQLERSGILMADGKVTNNNEKDTTSSSSDGTFSVTGRKGLVLTVLGIEKEGYRYVGRSTNSFGYRGTPEPHQADAAAPVDFLIVSNEASKTKILYHDFPKFSWNQGLVKIDIPSVGALTLLPTREKQPNQIRGFDWHLTVSMENAEMVHLGMEDAPLAPEIGYKKSFEYGGSREDVPWTGVLRQRYAFKTRAGLFGVIDLEVVARRSDGTQQGLLEVRINETGSRNLDR